MVFKTPIVLFEIMLVGDKVAVCEISSSINVAKMCRGCAYGQRTPRWTTSVRVRVQTSGAGMCRRVGL